MTESRIALLSSLACLALVVWLVIRPAPSAPMAPQAGAAPSFVTDAQVAAQLQELAARIEALQAQLAGQTVSRAEVPEAAAAAAATKLGSLAPLQEDLRALQFAVQALADAQAEASGGGVSHRLAELQREFPSMHWDACESLLQAALAAPDAREVSYLKSDNSPALAALLMLRPRDVDRQRPFRLDLPVAAARWRRAARAHHGADVRQGLRVGRADRRVRILNGNPAGADRFVVAGGRSHVVRLRSTP
jgi:hypothetical protein